MEMWVVVLIGILCLGFGFIIGWKIHKAYVQATWNDIPEGLLALHAAHGGRKGG